MNAVFKTWLTSTIILGAISIGAHSWADGISGTGKISRFGSIVMNGVHYDTSESLVLLNGENGTEADLRVGHQVIVETNGKTDAALVVKQFDTLRGIVGDVQITDLSNQSAQLVIMGQQVNTNIETVLHDISLDNVQAGDSVAIGGVRDSLGRITATSVERILNSSDQIVSGNITAIDTQGVHIGSLIITHPLLSEFLELEWVSVGQPIMARGSYDGAQLNATELLPAALHASHAIEMFVERLLEVRNGELFIGGYQLVIKPQTQLIGGDADDLRQDAHVQATGLLLPTGVLQAQTIEFVGDAEISVDGEVDDINTTQGTIRIGGIEATLDDDVTMKDLRDRFRYFGPKSIHRADKVRATLEKTPQGYRVKSLLRHQGLKKRLRAPLQKSNKWRAQLSAANHKVARLFDAREIQFDGENVSLFGFLLRVREGDDVEFAWDEQGRVDRIGGYSQDDVDSDEESDEETDEDSGDDDDDD